jgi:hypothetical protein
MKKPASIGGDTQTTGVVADPLSSNRISTVVAPGMSVSPSKITGGARIAPSGEMGPGIDNPGEKGMLRSRSHPPGMQKPPARVGATHITHFLPVER